MICVAHKHPDKPATNNRTYTIKVTATDPCGASASKSFTVTVTNVSRPPIAPSSIPSQTATEGIGFRHTVPAFTDTDGEVLTYTFSGLPGWLKQSAVAINPRYLSGTPLYNETTPGVPKVYTVTATATDPGGTSASKDFSVTVLDAPQR